MCSKPNLILIMTDQQRGDCLGCAGHPVVKTPNLDQLAEEGTYFPHAFSETPSCIPARASLLTGMDAWHTGILGMGSGEKDIPTNFAHTMPGELAQAGYHTQAVGKNHFFPQRALNGYHNCIVDESSRVVDHEFVSDYRAWFNEHKPQGTEYHGHAVDWNSWMGRPSHLPEHLHPTYWTADQGIRFLRNRDPEKPFFLKLSFARPHSPYDPPQVYYDMYRDEPMPSAPVGDWADGLLGEHANTKSVNAWCTKNLDEKQIAESRRCYYGSITFIDHQIGRVLYELRKHDPQAYRNSFIIFLSDHGDMLGDHYLWRKTYAYQGSAHVPMIVRPPLTWDTPRQQTCDLPVSLQDVMPSFLDAADVPIPENCTGLSMTSIAAPEYTHTAPLDRDYVHGQHTTCYSSLMAMHYLTDGKEKYVYLPYLGREQLFDLESDPMETHDLALDSDAAPRVERWRKRLIHELETRGCDTVVNGELQTLAPDQRIKSPHYGQYACTSD